MKIYHYHVMDFFIAYGNLWKHGEFLPFRYSFDKTIRNWSKNHYFHAKSVFFCQNNAKLVLILFRPQKTFV